MARCLSDSEVRHFRSCGYLSPLTIMDRAEADSYLRQCLWIFDKLHGNPRSIELRQMHLHFDWALRLASHTKILDVVEDILGGDIGIWATEIFAKRTCAPNISIRWHRDGTYIGLEKQHIVTVWVALSPSNRANGCMEVKVPRLGRGAGVPEDYDHTYLELRPGQASLHDADILHGSGPNQSNHDRVGFVIRYVSLHGNPKAEAAPVVPVRGHAEGSRLRICSPTMFQDPDTALAAMRLSALEHFQRVLKNLEASLC